MIKKSIPINECTYIWRTQGGGGPPYLHSNLGHALLFESLATVLPLAGRLSLCRRTFRDGTVTGVSSHAVWLSRLFSGDSLEPLAVGGATAEQTSTDSS